MAASNSHSFNKYVFSTMDQANCWVMGIKRMRRGDLLSTLETSVVLLCCYPLSYLFVKATAPIIDPEGLFSWCEHSPPLPTASLVLPQSCGQQSACGTSSVLDFVVVVDSVMDFYSDLAQGPLKWTSIPGTLQ